MIEVEKRSVVVPIDRVEETLKIRHAWFDGETRVRKSLSTTMRTAAHAGELAIRFLVGEGLVRSVRAAES